MGEIFGGISVDLPHFPAHKILAISPWMWENVRKAPERFNTCENCNENIALVDAFMKEFKHGTELGTKGNHQSDAFPKGNHGGYGGDYASATGTEAAGGNAVLAGTESPGDNIGYYRAGFVFNSEGGVMEVGVHHGKGNEGKWNGSCKADSPGLA